MQHDRPTVIFAYTIKGWSLPIEGHPENHSALLTAEQFAELAKQLGTDAEDPWAPFDAGSPEGELAAAAAARLAREEPEPHAPPEVPASLGRKHRGKESTQQAFGRFFVDLVHDAPEVAERVVTVSPDVASSTNLGGWINKAGIWSVGERRDWFADDSADAGALARDDLGPPHRARHRRDEPRRACWGSSAPPGAATASRCSRSGRSTTRSWGARSSRGRSGSTRAGSRS